MIHQFEDRFKTRVGTDVMERGGGRDNFHAGSRAQAQVRVLIDQHLSRRCIDGIEADKRMF